MKTSLGKELAKLRVDLGITSKQMASAVGVPAAYLSGVETGHKNMSGNLLNALCITYSQIKENRAHYETLIAMGDRNEVHIDLTGLTLADADLATKLARSFGGLTEGQKKTFV